MNATCSGNAARGALLSFPKRKLSPLRRACLSLGLPVDARPTTNLAWLLRKAGLRTTAIIEYLKFSKDEQARQIVERYNSLKNATERKAVTIDYLILVADADEYHILGCISAELYRVRSMEASLLVCLALPDAMRVTVREAKKPKGHSAREHLYKAAGILPVPKGSTTIINLLGGSRKELPKSDDESGDLEPADDFILRASRAMHGTKALPGSRI